MSTAEYLRARITATEAQIEAYEAAALALGTGKVQEYTIDTGQTRQTVTRADVSKIQTTIDALYNRRDVIAARLAGCQGATACPDF